MIIQIDSREKARAIKKIVEAFDQCGINHPVSKLMVGDYMNYDNPRLIIDRKQNLSELCNNVCQDHERFRKELIRAQENDIKMIFLVEHGKGIERLRSYKYCWISGRRRYLFLLQRWVCMDGKYRIQWICYISCIRDTCN